MSWKPLPRTLPTVPVLPFYSEPTPDCPRGTLHGRYRVACVGVRHVAYRDEITGQLTRVLKRSWEQWLRCRPVQQR